MPARNQTILVVDDELVPRKRIRTMLRGAGYNVIEAGDYDEAYAIFQRRADEISLLMSDVSLPGKNGCELAMAVLGVDPGAKVLLMSGVTGAEVCRFYGIPATDVHFLEKPFRESALLARVKYVLASGEPLTGTATGSAGA